jgi:hypothetical protein
MWSADSRDFHSKAASFQWVRVPPGNFRSGRKQSEQDMEVTKWLEPPV